MTSITVSSVTLKELHLIKIQIQAELCHELTLDQTIAELGKRYWRDRP